MSKHTPGPWFRSGCTVYALNEQKTCNRFAAWVQDAHAPRDELIANALIMQAAPDLLAALELVMDDPQSLDGRPRTYEAVRSAIAKARGEA